MDFFGSPLKTFPLVIIILAAIELIEKMEEINKKYKNMGLWNLTLWRFEGGGVTNTHCYAALFSIKRVFCKTNNIFYSL